MLRRTLILSFILTNTLLFAQETPKELEEVLFSQSRKNELTYIHLNQRTIERKLAADIGNILMLLPGLQIKNYGDVGGLKTAGFRSLGAAHSSIVIDFQNQPVTQSGNVDLSNIPTEFVQSVQMLRQDGTNTALPIHSKLSGSLIQINTLHSSFSEKNKFSLGFQNGSFGYHSVDLGTVLKVKKLQFTLTGRGRIYEGSFPFEYVNGNTAVREKRQNNGLKDLITTSSINWKPNEKHVISIKGSYFGSNKELSGAVVFYNANNQQYLDNQELNGTIVHNYTSHRLSILSQYTLQQSQLTYLDSNYLNALGYLKQAYTTHYQNAQSQFSYDLSELLTVNSGSEITYEEIIAGTINGSPKRLVFNQFAAARLKTKTQELNVQLGIQYVNDESQVSTRKNWNYLPSAQYTIQLSEHFQTGLIARYTVRQATFSELYYQCIGNTDLKPEEAYITSVPMKLNSKVKHWYNSFRLEPFYTYSTNKILAIPTKNLFVWSIQNIGKSQSVGVEVYNESRIKVGKGWFGQTLNFTYQEAIDLSDPNNVVYRNQLTYIPYTSGSLELDWNRANWSVYSLILYQGFRYALPENSYANTVDGYYTLDVGGSYKLNLKNHQLKLNVSLKNITNQYNQYIRYFVLPGFNYQIKLTYAI